MESNEFVDKLLSQTTLDAVDFASDVERILADQVVFLRGQLETCRQDSVVGAHKVIGELYARLADKDAQIASLQDEIRFLRRQIAGVTG